MIVRFGIIVSMVPSMAPIVPIVFLAFFVLQRSNTRIQQNLRRIHLQSSARLYSGFAETITGLAHIRGLQWQDWRTRENWSLVDRSQRVFHCILRAENQMQTSVDVTVMITATLFVTLAIYNEATPFRAGLAMLLLKQVNFNMLRTMKNWTKADVSMNSLDRIDRFVHNTPRTRDPDQVFQPANWPSGGDIVFSNISVQYGMKLN